MHHTAEELVKGPVSIKWPNDIYVGEKKVGGILLENVLQGNKIRFCIAGFGLNLNQAKFEVEKAASLSYFSGAYIDSKLARLKLCEKLSHYYALLKAKQYALLWDRYHQYLLGKGKDAWFKKGEETFMATIMGIDKKGKLHLLESDEIRSYAHKEVEFLSLITE
jgi:BirA family biotin operon repressor/biotin-[acetyl-CoA-carboxylase] ligase